MPSAMDQATGGETMHSRALYSTCREEPLMASGPFSHRLHLICGDSLMSEWGESLKVARTALVLEWLQKDPRAADGLRRRLCPMRLLRTSNVLWHPRKGLCVHRKALEIQRFYCEQTRRFVERSPSLPDWCRELVLFWDYTLDLLEHDPMALTDRADPFIKLALFEAVLEGLRRDCVRDRDRSWAVPSTGPHRRGVSPGWWYRAVSPTRPGRPIEPSPRVSAGPGRNRSGGCAGVWARGPPPRAELIAAMTGEPGVICNWAGLERRPSYDRLDLSNPTQTDTPVWRCNGDPIASSGVPNRTARRARDRPSTAAEPAE